MSYIRVVVVDKNDKIVDPIDLTPEGLKQASHLANQLLEEIDILLGTDDEDDEE